MSSSCARKTATPIKPPPFTGAVPNAPRQSLHRGYLAPPLGELAEICDFGLRGRKYTLSVTPAACHLSQRERQVLLIGFAAF